MRPKILRPMLANAMLNNQFVIIKGRPGVGKSAIGDAAVEDLRKTHRKSVRYLISYPYMEDPTQNMGLPFPSEDRKSAIFLPFGNVLAALTAKEDLVVWNIEDLGWADFTMQKSYANMITRREFNGQKFGPNVRIFATTNDTKDMAGVAGLMEPLKSRADTIVEFTVSNEDWQLWAIDNNMPVELVVHMRNCPDDLCDFKPTKQLTQSPCPRNWEHVGRWFNTGYKPDTKSQENLSMKEREAMEEHNACVREIYEGAVGKGAADKFWATCVLINKVPDINAILMDPDNHPVPDIKDASICYAVTTALAHAAKKGVFDAALRYAKRLEKQFEVLFVKDAWRRYGKDIVNTKAFNKWAIDPVNRDIVTAL